MPQPSPTPKPSRGPRVPLGPLAAVGLVGGVLALAVGSIAMVTGATAFFCPLVGLGGLLLAQFVFAWLLGVPVRGPEAPMGVPPDELDA